jgi:hypothetical protein
VETELFIRHKHNEAKHLSPILYFNRAQNLHYFEEGLAELCILQSLEELEVDGLQLRKLYSKEMVEPYTDIFLSHP